MLAWGALALAGCGGGDGGGAAVVADETPHCASGQVLEAGVCKTTPPACDAAEQLQANVCVPKAAGTGFKDCDGDCPELVMMPQGSFTMGSPDNEPVRSSEEGPQHTVTIGYGLAVGKYPVTVAQWAAFIQATGYQGDPAAVNKNNCPALGKADFLGYTPTPDDPIVCVNWTEVQKYTEWLSQKTGKNYRLLSEAEWEYAARAGTRTPYPFSATAGVNGVASYRDLMNDANGGAGIWVDIDPGTLDIYTYTSPVGKFPANAFGLYDMIGNVTEWTQDCFHTSYQDAPANGAAWLAENGGICSLRFLRGGSWEDFPGGLRAAARIVTEPVYRRSIDGFRVARTVP
jgi:formylglycine-generating enzyme required for sulfatase activity